MKDALQIIFGGDVAEEIYIGNVQVYKAIYYGDEQEYSEDKIGSNVQLGKAPVDALTALGGFIKAELKTVFRVNKEVSDGLNAAGSFISCSLKRVFDHHEATDALNAEGGFISATVKDLEL